jgi:hypothetical protein
VYYDANKTKWVSDGVTTSGETNVSTNDTTTNTSNATTVAKVLVQCKCTHLTEFSVVEDTSTTNTSNNTNTTNNGCDQAKLTNEKYQLCCKKGVDSDCNAARLSYIFGMIIIALFALLSF